MVAQNREGGGATIFHSFPYGEPMRFLRGICGDRRVAERNYRGGGIRVKVAAARCHPLNESRRANH